MGLVNLDKIKALVKEKAHIKKNGKFVGSFDNIQNLPKYVQDNPDKFKDLLGDYKQA
jgi:hypothetical protein